MTKQELVDELINHGYFAYKTDNDTTSMAGRLNSRNVFAFISLHKASYLLVDFREAEIKITVSLDVDPMLVFAFLESKIVELTEGNVLKFKLEKGIDE